MGCGIPTMDDLKNGISKAKAMVPKEAKAGKGGAKKAKAEKKGKPKKSGEPKKLEEVKRKKETGQKDS